MLSSRCTQSEDIWLWLGKEYQAQGRIGAAADAFGKLNTAEGLKYSWFPVDLLGKQKQLHGLDIPEDTVFAVKKMLDSLS